MRRLAVACLGATFLTTPALAQHAGHDMPMSEPEMSPAQVPAPAHAGHDMATMAPPTEAPAGSRAGHDMGNMQPPPQEAPPPPEAFAGPKHAADTIFDPAVMAEKREGLRANQGDVRAYQIMIDRLEARIQDGNDGYLWDAQAWYGGDIDKLWLKSEGEGKFGESLEDAEVQALWSHAISPWFDVQTGLRYDLRPEPERAHLVLGLQGLLPYVFELDAAAFLSDEGDLTARVEAEYDQQITQRLILQPRIELDLAAQDVPEIGVGSGLSSIALGLRLRYEFAREFAPYVGVEYERQIGDTADFARAEGEDADSWNFLVGVRMWF